MEFNGSDHNPWNIQSIYELQFFNCPTCLYKDISKESFVYHAYDHHSESKRYLENISDGSLDDINCPWRFKIDVIEEIDENQLSNSVTMEYYENMLESESLVSEVKPENNLVDSVIEDNSVEDITQESIKTKPRPKRSKKEKDPKQQPKEKLYKSSTRCTECKMEFRSFISPEEHDLHCKTLQNKHCEVCQLQFDDTTKLRNHRQKEHKTKECQHCAMVLPNIGKLNEHMKNKHSTNEWKCDICLKIFRQYNSMIMHIHKSKAQNL